MIVVEEMKIHEKKELKWTRIKIFVSCIVDLHNSIYFMYFFCFVAENSATDLGGKEVYIIICTK